MYNIGALIIRIGFGGISYCKYCHKEKASHGRDQSSALNKGELCRCAQEFLERFPEGGNSM